MSVFICELTVASQKLRASNCFSKNLCSLFLQNYFKKRGISIVLLRKTRPCRVTRRYSISIDEQIASCVANQIAVFAIVYDFVFTNDEQIASSVANHIAVFAIVYEYVFTNDEQIASSVANQIAAFAIVYEYVFTK